MNEKTSSEQLRLLATYDLQRSKSARLREVFDDVEWALAAGVSKTLIIEQLGKKSALYANYIQYHAPKNT